MSAPVRTNFSKFMNADLIHLINNYILLIMQSGHKLFQDTRCTLFTNQRSQFANMLYLKFINATFSMCLDRSLGMSIPSWMFVIINR